MSGLNDMFNEFPDYDVFTGETEPVKKRRRKPKPIRENTRDPEDYGDGFGIYVERKEYTRNFITVFYFLILILFLELVLRLSLLESFGFNSLLYTFTLSVPISAVLTFICTLFSQKVNRILSNIFTFIICFWFAFQLLYRVAEKHFFTFSKPSPIEFDALWKAPVCVQSACRRQGVRVQANPNPREGDAAARRGAVPAHDNDDDFAEQAQPLREHQLQPLQPRA